MYNYKEEVKELNNLEKDIKYIDATIISPQKEDGYYCKYSRILKSVVVTDMTKDSYLNYWMKKYKYEPLESQQKIIQACSEKLTNGLISTEEMIELVKNSNDRPSEIKKVLSLLQ